MCLFYHSRNIPWKCIFLPIKFNNRLTVSCPLTFVQFRKDVRSCNAESKKRWLCFKRTSGLESRVSSSTYLAFPLFFWIFCHVVHCANLGFVGSLGVIERESLLLEALGPCSWVWTKSVLQFPIREQKIRKKLKMLHKVKLYAFFSLVCDGPPDIKVVIL